MSQAEDHCLQHFVSAVSMANATCKSCSRPHTTTSLIQRTHAQWWYPLYPLYPLTSTHTNTHSHPHIRTNTCPHTKQNSLLGSLLWLPTTKSASISALMNSDESKVNYLLIEVCLWLAMCMCTCACVCMRVCVSESASESLVSVAVCMCEGDRHPGHKTHSLRLHTSWLEKGKKHPSRGRNHNRKNMLQWNYI